MTIKTILCTSEDTTKIKKLILFSSNGRTDGNPHYYICEPVAADKNSKFYGKLRHRSIRKWMWATFRTILRNSTNSQKIPVPVWLSRAAWTGTPWTSAPRSWSHGGTPASLAQGMAHTSAQGSEEKKNAKNQSKTYHQANTDILWLTQHKEN